jgi:F0F1-type ATP synthase alpha subunit
LCSIISQYSFNIELSIKRMLFCVFTCIAQKCSNVMRFYELLIRSKCNKFTSIIFVLIVYSMSLQFVSPLSAICISKYFRNHTLSCLIIYDLSKHSIAYEQLSLILRKPVGREAFPSDILFTCNYWKELVV